MSVCMHVCICVCVFTHTHRCMRRYRMQTKRARTPRGCLAQPQSESLLPSQAAARRAGLGWPRRRGRWGFVCCAALACRALHWRRCDVAGRYKPQISELDTRLKPFVPDYIPAVGDIDAFLKVRPQRAAPMPVAARLQPQRAELVVQTCGRCVLAIACDETRRGSAASTSAPGLRSPLPHLHRDGA